ncbi:hypothetical protein RO3G_11079 [Rhizopus delemar RA 99-880]|uniref:Uncharacterized protein n=1 Tax=Rhizopus delemar (strain RA 99-880 / ATCC MYA-4621 / FGSC 9543 / NRRL 43880) TaxID=246409 RepID=I1CD38_RHIO9|nr:hypothetical protein RO3G_11079 [Rhizopus delemar RA 99-880]|eukprot:EIE86368.1 hypothetical protein RO3G_11079 [Rhizopus delemar RA 99-880]
MDYVETFLTLNTEGPICTQSFFELVLKFDSKIKKITLLITKELDSIAREVIKDELKMIDPTSFTTKTDYPIELEMNTET